MASAPPLLVCPDGRGAWVVEHAPFGRHAEAFALGTVQYERGEASGWGWGWTYRAADAALPSAPWLTRNDAVVALVRGTAALRADRCGGCRDDGG